METPEWVKHAKVGDKVVCVCEGTRHLGPPTSLIAIGETYKIATIVSDDWFTYGAAFKIEGLMGNFGCRLFKPVSKRSTDTSMKVLKGILNGTPITETVDA